VSIFSDRRRGDDTRGVTNLSARGASPEVKKTAEIDRATSEPYIGAPCFVGV
jgi:hypothetical protein